MHSWLIALEVALLASTVITHVFFVTWYRCYHHRINQEKTQSRTTQNFYAELLQIREGTEDLNPRHNNHCVANVWNNGYNYSHGYSLKVFNWTNHPSLIGEAIEHG